MRRKLFTAFTFVTLFLAVSVARAEVIISGTRVIYEEKLREGMVKISNTGNVPVLLQAWIDNGDASASPETIKVPFSMTPPVVRLDPQKEQTIRLFRTGAGLPADRESLFWFNLLEIPPKPTKNSAGDENKLQLAVRTRIKMFYRPEQLALSPEQAAKNLKFTISGKQVVIKNASPYYITFRTLEFRALDKGPILASLNKTNNKMVAPFSELSLPINVKSSINASTRVYYSIINDFGGETQSTQSLTP